MREYATHFIEHILKLCKQKMEESQQDQEEIKSLIQLMEQQFVLVYLKNIKDEMVLRNILLCLRSLVVFVHDTHLKDSFGLDKLYSLVSKDTEQDFFHEFFSIKLKQR